MTLGKLLRCIREEQRMSQAEFGALFGRQQRDISFFETDNMVPPRDFLNAVAAHTGDEVLAAYICGERDRDMIRSAVEHSVRKGVIQYA